jgi:hypothetical protein
MKRLRSEVRGITRASVKDEEITLVMDAGTAEQLLQLLRQDTIRAAGQVVIGEMPCCTSEEDRIGMAQIYAGMIKGIDLLSVQIMTAAKAARTAELNKAAQYAMFAARPSIV